MWSRKKNTTRVSAIFGEEFSGGVLLDITGKKVCNHFLSHLLATGSYDFLTVWGSQEQLTGTLLCAYCFRGSFVLCASSKE